MSQKLIFAQTFEGLLRAFGARLTAEHRDQLRAVGFDPDARPQSAYPHPVFIATVRTLARACFADRPEEDGIDQVARGFLDGFGETLIGRAMVGMLRLIGPEGALKRITQQFRTANNFTLPQLTQLGVRRYQFWVNDLHMPGWYVGIVTRGLELSGAVRPRVRLLSRDDTGGSFLVEWDS